MTKNQKFIFIIGGVVSGLGKGISGASIASILKQGGFKVFLQKLDPYLNVDPGTMNPFEHGEVYVTADGAETDLDLGHYERFINTNMNKTSNVTAGQIYDHVLCKERHGDYEGKTVQVVPHVTNLIKQKIFAAAKNSDILICEVGGTVGDIESLPFIEAIRQIRLELTSNNVMVIHVGLVPFLDITKESKTKPVQHSVKQMLACGVPPDVIIARTNVSLSKQVINKIALYCNIKPMNVITALDANSIYEVPLQLQSQNAYQVIASALNLPLRQPDMRAWVNFTNKIKNAKGQVKIALVGKYTNLRDAYLSVIESINIAAVCNSVKAKIKMIESSTLTKDNYQKQLADVNGILIPGGFGVRGIEGMIFAVYYARENKIPFLGLCLGMQVAAIEYGRNVCKLQEANSVEFEPNTKHPLFKMVAGKNHDDNLGGTLRLGDYLNKLTKGSLIANLYQSDHLVERHRHRYEFNNQYKDIFIKHGLVFSGIYEAANLIEVIELPGHPFFLGTQFHPEFTSRPNKPNPIFMGFIKAIMQIQLAAKQH